MGMWRDRVAKCIGFDPKKTAPIDPVRIVVIDRPYETVCGCDVYMYMCIYRESERVCVVFIIVYVYYML